MNCGRTNCEAVSLHAGSESAVPTVSGVGNTPPGSPYDERPLAPTAYSLTNGGIHGGAVPPAHSDLTYASMPIAATSYAMANAKLHPTTGSPQLQPPQSKLASSLSLRMLLFRVPTNCYPVLLIPLNFALHFSFLLTVTPALFSPLTVYQ